MKVGSIFVTVKLFSVIAIKDNPATPFPKCLDHNNCMYIEHGGLTNICVKKGDQDETPQIQTEKSSLGNHSQSTSLSKETSRQITALITTRAPTKLVKERQNTTRNYFSTTEKSYLSLPQKSNLPTVDIGHGDTLLEFGLEKCNCSRKLTLFRKVK